MSTKHTQGRVKVQHPHAGDRGWEVAFEPGLEQLCQDITEENARRLVACWNACEGVPTELLERAPLDTALKETTAQRDELLATLKACNQAIAAATEALPINCEAAALCEQAENIARAAIAKATTRAAL